LAESGASYFLPGSAHDEMWRSLCPAKEARLCGPRIIRSAKDRPLDGLSNSLLSDDQSRAGLLFARYAARPRPAKPNANSAQEAGSGTAAPTVAESLKPPGYPLAPT
jgi:hypothetical protein